MSKVFTTRVLIGDTFHVQLEFRMFVFEERGKPEYPKKRPVGARREPATNSTHIWRLDRESNPSHIGGRRVFSPLHHPCCVFRLFSHFFFCILWASNHMILDMNMNMFETYSVLRLKYSVWMAIAVMYTTSEVVRIKPEKNSGLNGNRTRTLRLPVQCSHQWAIQANWQMVTRGFVLYP